MKPDSSIQKLLDKARLGKNLTEPVKTKCPLGTVPIRRTTKEALRRSKYLLTRGDFIPLDEGNGDHFGGFHRVPDTVNLLKGATTVMSIWNPKVLNNQSSGAYISLESGQGPQRNYVRAGWVVDPILYGSNLTRMFIRWTIDDGHGIGCYNLMCPGFVVTNNEVPIDAVFKVVSQGNEIQTLGMHIFQDSNGWVLTYNFATVLGYWPSVILPDIVTGASELLIGGQIYYPPTERYNPNPVMGSGIVMRGNLVRSAYFAEIEAYNDARESFIPAMEMWNRHACYRGMYEEYREDLGFLFLYGGPLFSICYND